MKIWNLIRKYTKRVHPRLKKSELIKEYPYSFLTGTQSQGFNYLCSLVAEARKKCLEEGYKISHISMFTAYDADIIEDHLHIDSKSDDYIAIYKNKDGLYFAVIFSGSWITAEYLTLQNL
jgi:hypothetical protein